MAHNRLYIVRVDYFNVDISIRPPTESSYFLTVGPNADSVRDFHQKWIDTQYPYNEASISKITEISDLFGIRGSIFRPKQKIQKPNRVPLEGLEDRMKLTARYIRLNSFKKIS